ncbi:5-methylcytosine-specific restriction enzyme A [Parapedobacter luteus]|uniref:5-methylcytosine-specific restriction enzyme A n=1 Tax=Parapedobacter luteus TaxID=623280 RepID=A0A1T5CTT8_9SPHI|nr:HNH endonuclease [Parapedobacter luteus]SKB62743.1 5-methylcytosine-specific restriction enzyme A [Parapedobacter luteus]
MRNPKWHRDELILALDLYFKLEPGQIHARNPTIVELSQTLNALPFSDAKTDAELYRNPNGVGLKLSNFLAIDPNYKGKGMQSYSKLDEQVFKEFVNNQILLRKLASNIKATLLQEKLVKELKAPLVEDEEGDEYSAPEGKLLYKLHRYRERNRTLVEKKKKEYLKKHGSLACELCSFDFEKVYGATGKGFIECHHRTPLSELTPDTKTTLNDLMLICSNCHRMVHRGWDNKTVKNLKKGRVLKDLNG